MLRVFLTFAVLAYVSTAPFSGTGLKALLPNQQVQRFGAQKLNVADIGQDDSETVDNMGAGYSFFKKQPIDLQSFSQAPSPVLQQDVSEYMFSSALKPQGDQKKVINPTINQLAQVPFQRQQQQLQSIPIFNQQQQQSAFDQTLQNKFQPALTSQQRNIFGQIAFRDPETLSPQQQPILIPQTNLNRQTQNFAGFNTQQQDRSISALPQQTWNNQMNPTSFASSFGVRSQQPMASPQVLQALANQRQTAPSSRTLGGW